MQSVGRGCGGPGQAAVDDCSRRPDVWQVVRFGGPSEREIIDTIERSRALELERGAPNFDILGLFDDDDDEPMF